MTPETDRFHAHLDKCYQCREHPMDLCPTGAKLLTEAACSVSPIDLDIPTPRLSNRHKTDEFRASQNR
jgi:hypothetical protein